MNSNIRSPVTPLIIVNGVLMFSNTVARACQGQDETQVAMQVVMAPHSPDTVEDALTAAIREPVVSAITTTASGGIALSFLSAHGVLTSLT
jgi:hypothetical protein